MGSRSTLQNPEGDRALNVIEVDTGIVEKSGPAVIFRVETRPGRQEF
jgi:hypothetical protein